MRKGLGKTSREDRLAAIKANRVKADVYPEPRCPKCKRKATEEELDNFYGLCSQCYDEKVKASKKTATAHSELFVDEDVRDAITDQHPDLGYIVVDVPQEWRDIWDPSEYPSGGTANVLNDNDEVLGSVSWKVKFEVESSIGGKYIEAFPIDVVFTPTAAKKATASGYDARADLAERLQIAGVNTRTANAFAMDWGSGMIPAFDELAAEPEEIEELQAVLDEYNINISIADVVKIVQAIELEQVGGGTVASVKKTAGKKVILELVGLDGNAFALMGAFSKAARRQGWSKEDIKAVLDECQSGDYDHLLATLMDNTESPDEDAGDEVEASKKTAGSDILSLWDDHIAKSKSLKDFDTPSYDKFFNAARSFFGDMEYDEDSSVIDWIDEGRPEEYDNKSDLTHFRSELNKLVNKSSKKTASVDTPTLDELFK